MLAGAWRRQPCAAASAARSGCCPTPSTACPLALHRGPVWMLYDAQHSLPAGSPARPAAATPARCYRFAHRPERPARHNSQRRGKANAQGPCPAFSCSQPLRRPLGPLQPLPLDDGQQAMTPSARKSTLLRVAFRSSRVPAPASNRDGHPGVPLSGTSSAQLRLSPPPACRRAGARHSPPLPRGEPLLRSPEGKPWGPPRSPPRWG